jgi:putative colanic acid biosynthesis UDP-glucose lipid carrier transferase
MMITKRRGQYGRYIPSILTITDYVLVNMLYTLTYYLSPDMALMSKQREVWLLVNVAYIPVVLWQHFKDYNRRAIVMDLTVINAFRSVGVHALFFAAMMEFINLGMTLRSYTIFYSMMAVMLPLWWLIDRRLLKYMRSRGRNFLRVVIIGTNENALRLAEEMQADAGFGYKVYGFFDKFKRPGFDKKYLGTIDTLDEYVKSHAIDEIFFALSGEDDMLRHVVKVTDDNVMQFYYVPQLSKYVNRNFAITQIGAMPVLTLLHNPLKNPVNSAIKRVFDILFSSIFLLLSPIIFIPVAIGIKMTSPGPIFFKQKRTGYLGNEFNCYKFRTMHVNNTADSAQATKDDPRKTRFGDFLRRTSIDELPQFFNVLRGDMSVVGPRPHMLKHTDYYSDLIKSYMVRHVVRPGITGWAQVNGYRGITDELWKMEKRVEYDVWYIEHWNFFLDLKIIVRTVFNAFAGESNAF